MREGTDCGWVTSRAILSAIGPANCTGSDETGEVVAYYYWRDLHRPVVREVGPMRVMWHLDRIRYTGIWLNDTVTCRSIGHWNRPDQLEYFAVVAGEVSMHLQQPGAEPTRVHLLRADGAVLAVPAGSWHHTTARAPATVDNIYCYLESTRQEDKYARQGQPVAFAPRLASRFMEKHTLVQLFSGEGEQVWQQLDHVCDRLFHEIGLDRR
jgi:hypothetical protein